MFLAQFFQSFQPFRNPIGFGAADYIELAVALWLAVFLLIRPWIEPSLFRLAKRTGWCMLILAVAPVALRLALLPHHPVPAPAIYDEFSHLLAADTLSHFRLANPPHPLPQFFETFFVLQQPTYSSIYPIGQGLAMAIGRLIFGLPWAGVVLSVAAFCALCYWMLRGWTTAAWALIGGALAVIEFGPLNLWMNCYWSGAFAACAGCLVFGALPRLSDRARVRDGALLGLGLAMHLLTRPYESIFLGLSVALFFLPSLRQRDQWRRLARPALAMFLVAAGGVAVALLHDKQVTGSWTVLPEMLSQYQYGVPATFTIQPNAVPHRELTPQQELGYKMQAAFHGSGAESVRTFLTRLEYRVRYYRFFFFAPLYLALLFYLAAVRSFRFVWVLVTLALFALGTNLFPAFQFHYIAAVTCLFVLVSVVGLRQLSRLCVGAWPAGRTAALLLLLLCGAHFVFWYSLNLLEDTPVSSAMRRYETWDGINSANPGRRTLVTRRLMQIPGKQLVFVRYWPDHVFQDEWVYNAADIDHAWIVWARDLGPVENEKLRRYYPDRTAWLLEPDADPPRLSPYQVVPAESRPAPAKPEVTKPAPKKPALRFEEVR